MAIFIKGVVTTFQSVREAKAFIAAQEKCTIKAPTKPATTAKKATDK